MKITLNDACGYTGLKHIEYPVTVEAGWAAHGLYAVEFKNLAVLPGFIWLEDDTEYGTYYSFFLAEVEPVTEADVIGVVDIVLKANPGYIGLRHVSFPVTVQAHHIAADNTAYVRKSQLMAIPGFEWNTWDTTVRSDYTFFKGDYEVVGDVETIAACRAVIDNYQARKDDLIQMVVAYGCAINDGCYESECGTMTAMEECHAEEKRLLDAIIAKIQEGV